MLFPELDLERGLRMPLSGISPNTVPGLFCHVVERLQTSARELGPALTDRLEHAAMHTRGAVDAVGEGEQSGLQTIARLENSAGQAEDRVPIYGRTPAGEWKSINADEVIRRPLFNRRDETAGVVYPDSAEMVRYNRLWVDRKPGTLRTPQTYELKPAEGDALRDVVIRSDRPDEPRPFDDDVNVISLHGRAGGRVFQVNVGPRTDERPYGEPVWLEPKSAARLVASDPVYAEVVAGRKDRDVVVAACDTGAHQDVTQSFADTLFTAGTTDGTLHFPTDTLLMGRADPGGRIHSTGRFSGGQLRRRRHPATPMAKHTQKREADRAVASRSYNVVDFVLHLVGLAEANFRDRFPSGISYPAFAPLPPQPPSGLLAPLAGSGVAVGLISPQPLVGHPRTFGEAAHRNVTRQLHRHTGVEASPSAACGSRECRSLWSVCELSSTQAAQLPKSSAARR
ncbi:hypothetical protein [Nocardia testacea]|uniref:hypothetical protein n=1 Tax=Nocardia testacea TaxID=248551 RepID=UPI0034103C0B